MTLKTGVKAAEHCFDITRIHYIFEYIKVENSKYILHFNNI